jgi:hypothetical protein
MTENLGMTAYPYCPAAIVVLERTVDALGCAALVVADLTVRFAAPAARGLLRFFGGLVTGLQPGQRFRRGFGLAAPARIGPAMGTCPSARLFSRSSSAS